MKPDVVDYRLYLVTDRALMSCATVEELVEQALWGGCTVVQLREKELSSADFYRTAQQVREITARYEVPLIINDRVDIALAVDADGVHVGQKDLPARVVRSIIGPEKILGLSARTLEEALRAVRAGADYLGVGAMFNTGTKNDAVATSIAELQRICDGVEIPVVAIGGINSQTISALQGVNIDGVAVVSAIASQSDIPSAARELKALFIKGRS